MLKRLVATVFVSALAVLGVAPAASAVPVSGDSGAPVVNIIDWDSAPRIIDWDSAPRIIDWDAPPVGGGVVVPHAIDWD